MGRFDAATQLFIDKVAEDAPHSHDMKGALRLARKAIDFGHDPKKTLGRVLVGAATKELTKEGSMGVIHVYEALNENHGKDWWDWEPETVWQTLAVEQGIAADQELKDLVMALQIAVTTNYPFESWNVFEKVTCAFNQNDVDFHVIQPPEIDEIAFTVSVLRTLRGESTPYEDEVLGYIAACAKHSGIVYLPPELYPSRAQEFLDKLNNDLELKARVQSKKDDGSAAYKIQALQLKEVAEYVSWQKK